MSEPKTSPRRIDAATRRRRALELRLAGATMEQIARAPRDPAAGDNRPMYSSRQRAHEAVKAALDEITKETKGNAEQLRAVELARLESMHRALWPSTRPVKAVTETCPCGCEHQITVWREPDKDAVDRVIKLMERRAKYLGLDVKGAETDHSTGVSMIMNLMGALDAHVGDNDPFAGGEYASHDS